MSFSSSHLIPCTGATLTALYAGANVEQEQVSSDPGLFQMNVTGGQAGSGVDGSASIRVSIAAEVSAG